MITVGIKVRFVFLMRSFDDVFITTQIELVTISLHCSPTLFSVQEGHRRTPAVGRAGSRADKDERRFGVDIFNVDEINKYHALRHHQPWTDFAHIAM